MNRLPWCLLPLLLLGVGAGGCAHEPLAEEPAMRLDAVPFSWGTGGAFTTSLRIDDGAWADVTGAFRPEPQTPPAERLAIARAVHRLQLVACEQTPVKHAMGFSEVDSAGQGRMDCVDCSTATTRFLQLLDQQGLIRRHEVMQALWRYAGGVLPVHRGAVIRDRATGERFVVDPWLAPYRDAPAVIALDRWKAFDDTPEFAAPTAPAPAAGTPGPRGGSATGAP